VSELGAEDFTVSGQPAHPWQADPQGAPVAGEIKTAGRKRRQDLERYDDLVLGGREFATVVKRSVRHLALIAGGELGNARTTPSVLGSHRLRSRSP